MTRLSPPMASIDDIINEWKRQLEKRVRADFAEPVKVCNASQRETYKPEPAYYRNDGHKHLKSMGVLWNALVQQWKSEEASREASIADKNREIEAHMRMAEQCAGMCQFHRETARQLAKQVDELVMGRSAETVARMERERGLS